MRSAPVPKKTQLRAWVEKTLFVISGERSWMYLYTSVSNEFMYLWHVNILPEDLKRSWKASLYFFNNNRKVRSWNLIHFMHNCPVAEHPNQRAMGVKEISYKHWLLVHAVLEALFRAYNLRFAFLNTILRCFVCHR